ncbi:MAG: zinc ribbon domain-containing protein [Lachnospiraceae bacterium]|nr:zinc ribbon domain-containing protein [Lachnospiraceae bacterium]
MKYCSSCGKMMDDKAIFCPVCGQRNDSTVTPMSMTSAGQAYGYEDLSQNYTRAIMPSQSPVQPQPYEQTQQLDPYTQPYVQPQPQPYGEAPKPAPEPRPAPTLYIPASDYRNSLPESLKKEKPNVAAIVILAVLFFAGLLAEILLKTSVYRTVVNTTPGLPASEIRRIVFRQVCLYFSSEATPLYALLIYGLNAMRINPGVAVMGLLRWLPYLVLFFLPLLASIVQKKGVPLIISGGFTLLEGLKLLFLSFGVRGFGAYNALPFLLEAIIAVLLAVAFFAKNKPLCIIAGVLALIFALLAPALSAALSQMNAAMMPGRNFFRALRMAVKNFRFVFQRMNGSYWPVYKFFVLLMYAFLAFLSVGRLKKAQQKETV